MATSCAQGNCLVMCLATSTTSVAAGGLINGSVMVTLRPEGGTPALDTGNNIVPSKRVLRPRDSSCKDASERGHAVKGTRAGPVGSKGNIENGSTVFGNGVDVG